jgi:hypothetical protein
MLARDEIVVMRFDTGKLLGHGKLLGRFVARRI